MQPLKGQGLLGSMAEEMRYVKKTIQPLKGRVQEQMNSWGLIRVLTYTHWIGVQLQHEQTQP